MYKVDVKRGLAYEAGNTKKTGAFRLYTYKIEEDDFGAYIFIPRKKKKVYLTHSNCIKIN